MLDSIGVLKLSIHKGGYEILSLINLNSTRTLDLNEKRFRIMIVILEPNARPAPGCTKVDQSDYPPIGFGPFRENSGFLEVH